jgi:hypothetical protein
MDCICERKSTGRLSTEAEAVESAAAGDQELMRWPPLSPDLTPCDFLLWGFIKDRVVVPSFPATLVDLHTRITAAITVTDHDMLQRVWQ